MLAATKRRAFWALARTDASDLLREKLTWASMLTLMLVLLVIHTSMWLAFAVTGSAPRIAQHDLAAISATPQLVEPHAAAITEQLAPFVATRTEDVPNVTLRIAAAESTAAENGTERVTVTLRESGIGWDPVWQALRVAGMPAGSIDVVDAEGEPIPDFLRVNLGTEFLAVLASVALIGTTVPLVAARERGMLRLLGTTPLSRRLFLASRIPTRLALLLACTAGVAAIGLARRYTEVSALPRFAVTVACAAVMLFGVGAVFSARARNAEASQSLMAGISSRSRLQRRRGVAGRDPPDPGADRRRAAPRQLDHRTGERGPRRHHPAAARARLLGTHARDWRRLLHARCPPLQVGRGSDGRESARRHRID